MSDRFLLDVDGVGRVIADLPEAALRSCVDKGLTIDVRRYLYEAERFHVNGRYVRAYWQIDRDVEL